MAALESSVNAIRIAASAADRLKATNCQAFDVSNLLGITDAMLIVSASNERQVLAVSEEIEKDLYLKDNKRKPISREGLELAQWILLDFGDFVVHIMHEEAREFYRLERLWNDCPAIDLQLPEHSESYADGDDGDDSDDGDDVDNAQNVDNQESER
ncbi:ribosome silencing factor [Gardnerella pickettii]|uniref:ribosome silencing factor n=1 Tax=Gardnerella pickettii TaxID=2914924 RepID=UPI00339B8C3A|nr:ribosome silencing factor [Bifidobacterium sp. UMB9259]